jgi:hypothetical protein
MHVTGRTVALLKRPQSQAVVLAVAGVLLLALPLGAQDIPMPAGFGVFAGSYVLPTGDSIRVEFTDGSLTVDWPGGDLFRLSDARKDSRVLAVEAKSVRLMAALARRDRDAIAGLMITSPGTMSAYIDATLELLSPALNDKNSVDDSEVELLGTVYRDEDSEFGFGDDGWGWQVYLRIVSPMGGETVRLVWDGVSGALMHRGTGGEPPSTSRLIFTPRRPGRSWIRVYDPPSGTTPMLREVDAAHRALTFPARFVAYDVDTHHSVGLRFRRAAPGDPMVLEIGPLTGGGIQGVRSN